VPERGSVGVRRGRIGRINIWIAATLLQPRTATASAVAAIAITRLINLFSLVLMKPAESLWVDCTEAYAWGQQFLLGYGRHPPLTGWIAGLWYRVFPAANWSSYALSEVMIGCSLISVYLIGERVLGRRRATLVLFVMMLYPVYIAANSDRFNNTQVLLAILPLTIWLFLRAYERPTLMRGLALGLAAVAVMLTYYSASFGLVGLAIAAVLLTEAFNHKNLQPVDGRLALELPDVRAVMEDGHLEVEAIPTPGHSDDMVCFVIGDLVFSGDTLFNAGAGNCHHGGQPELLYETFIGHLARLPDATRVYPGHEYVVRNLEFTLDREPGNADAAALLARARAQDPADAVVTTLGEEKRVNTFFRLQNPEVIARLRESFPTLGAHPDARTVFLKLRELRNKW